MTAKPHIGPGQRGLGVDEGTCALLQGVKEALAVPS